MFDRETTALMRRPGETLTFHGDDGDDFSAMRKAEAWCAENGFSVGHAQRGAPRGLLRGDEYDIQKWRNLRGYEKRALHGIMWGDNRQGPVHVKVFEVAAMKRPAAQAAE